MNFAKFARKQGNLSALAHMCMAARRFRVASMFSCLIQETLQWFAVPGDCRHRQRWPGAD
jgi:hypothetical protein